MKIAILGAGHIARLHAPAIRRQPDARIVAVADQDPVRAHALARDLGVPDVFAEPAALLEHAKPDVVHVLVPPHDHARLSLLAMRHGCHVYVEKPMALGVADADEMIAVARAQNVCLCVGHNLLFDQTVQRAIGLIERGAVGETVSVEACYRFDPCRYPAILEEGAEHCHWAYRLNGGPLQDLMPHMGSLLCRFVAEVDEVHAAAQHRGLLPAGWSDEIRVLVRSRAVLGVLGISLSERPDTISLVVRGSQGTVHADLFTNIVTLERRSALPRAITRGLAGFRLAAQHFGGSLGNVIQFSRGRTDTTGGLGPLIARFYAAVREGSGPPIALDESRRVVDLMTRIWPEPRRQPDRVRVAAAPRCANTRPVALVTGATGFIGSHLVTRLLADGVTVRALVRRNSAHAGRLVDCDVEIVEGDLTEPALLAAATRGAQVVYHVGAPMGRSWTEHRDTTIQGTAHLLGAAIDAGVERFVHVSTLAVYDLARARAGTVITEDWPYQDAAGQMGAYAYAKIEAEKRVFDAGARRGLPVTVVRPGIVLGPRGQVFFPHLGYRIGDRLFIVPGDARVPLPLTSVESTVDGIRKTATSPRAVGRAYNLVDDGAITIADYLRGFIEATGTGARIVVLPFIAPFVATAGYELAARIGLLPAGITSRAQLRWKRARVRFDTTRARTELGWTPAMPLEAALSRTFAWYSARHRVRA